MAAKKILMLLNEPYPGDIRVLKETESLLQNGFEVHLLCLKKNKAQKKEEVTQNGLNIHRTSSSSTFQKGVWDIVISLFFIHPIFFRRASLLLQRHHFNALHVHDLPLAFTGFRLAEKFGAKKVLDLHENYPEALAVWFKWRKNPFIKIKNRLFFSYKRWAKYEVDAIKRADHIITVVDEMKERMILKSGVDAPRFSVVSNTEQKEFLNQIDDQNIYEDWKDKFVITYVGNVGPHRGVDTVVAGMSYLKNLPDCKLVIAGSMSKAVKTHLLTLCSNDGLQDSVRLLGYQPFLKFFSFMKNASVNIIPHNSNPHTDNTIPHKLFQCMMVGRPVIVSSCKPLKRVVESTNSGLVFTADDPLDFSRKVAQIYNDRVLYDKLALSGQKATLEGVYNWETDSNTLLSYYQSI